MVMELVRGMTIRRLLRTGYRFEAKEVVEIAHQAADALRAVRAAGLIHRDVKPENLMIQEGNRLKVLDLGLARRLDRCQSQITEKGAIVGTLPYAAPEILKGGQADTRSDIYSLGLVRCEMPARRPLFEGDHPAPILNQIVEGKREVSLPRGVPQGLHALVEKMIAREPASCPWSMSEVISLLRS